MAEQDRYAEIPFPERGINIARSFAEQKELTTPVGTNVMLYEPLTFRARGGMRPGLVKYNSSDQVPAGSQLLQELNFIVLQSTIPLLTTVDLWSPNSIPDPSSPGPASSWGTNPLLDPDGNPLSPTTTGATQGTRNPTDPGTGSPRKTRPGGTPITPNKNTLQYVPGSPDDLWYFIANYAVRFDGGSLDGQILIVEDDGCFPYNPPLVLGPSSALAFPHLNDNLAAEIAVLTAQGETFTAATPVLDHVFGPIRLCT